MSITYQENLENGLSRKEIESVVRDTLDRFSGLEEVLLIHPDYSRHDFADVIVPMVYRALEKKGLKRLDTLNSAGTHRRMSEEEILSKLGLSRNNFPKLGTLHNHEYDDPRHLIHVGDVSREFVSEKTGGHLNEPMSITANKLIAADYDLILALSGTVPHEAIGFSGGLKLFFPGISGPEVIALLHWASVLIGVPEVIGKLENPARDVVIEGAKHFFNCTGNTPLVSLNMLYSEHGHELRPNGLYTGVGLEGFVEAQKRAAQASSKIHMVYIDEEKDVIVQHIPEMYDEIWTAGKGSYKVQRPGVMAKDGEVILFAPHIDCFHSNKHLDEDIRKIGYHCRDWVVDYTNKNPDFDKNVASHSINVRGPGVVKDGVEECAFKVTLATQISEEDCLAVGLGYRDPKSLKQEDFSGPGQLWIEDGAKWLYNRR